MKKYKAIIALALTAVILVLVFPDIAVKAGRIINNTVPALGRLWGKEELQPADPLAGADDFVGDIIAAIGPEPISEDTELRYGRKVRDTPGVNGISKYNSSTGSERTGNGLRGQPITVEELQALPVPEYAPDPDNLVYKSEEWHERYGMGYYLVVNYKANTVTVYVAEYGKGYNVPVKAMVCSCGYDTPRSGFFELGVKKRWVWLFGKTAGQYVYGQYSTEICGDILFHSVPYTKFERPNSLEYEEFDKLGTSASAGCVRLQVEDARWIYMNAHRIVGVQFIADDDPGPLGKPEAMKISNYYGMRGWDPTDPDKNNPWHRYLRSIGEK